MTTSQEKIEEVKKKIIEESHQMTAFTYQIEEADLDEAFETLSNTIHEELAKEVEGKETPLYPFEEGGIALVDNRNEGMSEGAKIGFQDARTDIATLCRSKIIK